MQATREIFIPLPCNRIAELTCEADNFWSDHIHYPTGPKTARTGSISIEEEFAYYFDYKKLVECLNSHISSGKTQAGFSEREAINIVNQQRQDYCEHILIVKVKVDATRVGMRLSQLELYHPHPLPGCFSSTPYTVLPKDTSFTITDILSVTPMSDFAYHTSTEYSERPMRGYLANQVWPVKVHSRNSEYSSKKGYSTIYHTLGPAPTRKSTENVKDILTFFIDHPDSYRSILKEQLIKLPHDHNDDDVNFIHASFRFFKNAARNISWDSHIKELSQPRYSGLPSFRIEEFDVSPLHALYKVLTSPVGQTGPHSLKYNLLVALFNTHAPAAAPQLNLNHTETATEIVSQFIDAIKPELSRVPRAVR